MENRITVTLTDGTVGNIDYYSIDDSYTKENIVGETMNVHFYDDDGNSIEKAGIVANVLRWDV